MNTVKLSDKHIEVIISALHVYYRLKAGQISIALDRAYGCAIPYKDMEKIEKYIKLIVFSELNSNGSSYGFNSPKIGDARLAYEIEKTFEEFISVKKNDGYYGWTTNFDGPLKATDEPLPVILEHKNHKDFKLNKRQSQKIIKLCSDKMWDKAWDYITNNVKRIPKGEKKCIEIVDGTVYIKVVKPHKLVENENIV